MSSVKSNSEAGGSRTLKKAIVLVRLPLPFGHSFFSATNPLGAKKRKTLSLKLKVLLVIATCLFNFQRYFIQDLSMALVWF